MRTSKRGPAVSLIRRLLAEPHRFEFVQALRIIELWLRKNGVRHDRTLVDHVRIKQSVSLSFPASQIEALTVDAGGAAATDAALGEAWQQDRLRHFHVTPTFMGLLGVNGVLPLHYTELIGARAHMNKDEGPRAFLDSFATRSLTLFYHAWSKYRVYYRVGKDGRDGLLPLQLAIAGAAPGLRSYNPRQAASTVCDEAAGFYAAVARHRAASPRAIAGVLAEYFGVPIALTQFTGRWDYLPQRELCRLGVVNRTLGHNAMLGTREWRRDLCVRLRVGPLAMADYERFLPNADGAKALRVMLSLFPVPALQFEVQLLLRATDVQPARLSARRTGAILGLGEGLFLAADPREDREGIIYRLEL
jgi:type VI secretion system protein ImpH